MRLAPLAFLLAIALSVPLLTPSADAAASKAPAWIGKAGLAYQSIAAADEVETCATAAASCGPSTDRDFVVGVVLTNPTVVPVHIRIILTGPDDSTFADLDGCPEPVVKVFTCDREEFAPGDVTLEHIEGSTPAPGGKCPMTLVVDDFDAATADKVTKLDPCSKQKAGQPDLRVRLVASYVDPCDCAPTPDFHGATPHLHTGQSVYYNLSVTNIGLGEATDVLATLTLPKGADLGCMPDCGPFTPDAKNKVLVPLGAIDAARHGPSFPFPMTVPGKAGAFTTKVSVSLAQKDGDGSNNKASIKDKVVKRVADLAVELGGGEALVDGNVTFTFSPSNHGPDDVKGAPVYFTLPTGHDLTVVFVDPEFGEVEYSLVDQIGCVLTTKAGIDHIACATPDRGIDLEADNPFTVLLRMHDVEPGSSLTLGVSITMPKGDKELDPSDNAATLTTSPVAPG